MNVVIAAGVVIVAVVTVRRYLSPEFAPPPAIQQKSQALIGTRMSIPGLTRGADQKHLVLFLKKGCPACGEAAPVYRQLVAEASRRGVPWVAIVPDSLEDGRQYLRSLSLSEDHVRSANLASYRITAVPTALVVDGEGVVQGAWIGVPPGHEAETQAAVLKALDKL